MNLFRAALKCACMSWEKRGKLFGQLHAMYNLFRTTKKLEKDISLKKENDQDN